MSELVIAQTADELVESAGLRIIQVGNEAIARDGRFVLALSGGSTPKKLHAFLIRPDIRTRIDWTKTIFLWGDERTVPPDHENSNFRMARETLLEPLGIDDAQIIRMPADAPDLEQAASAHQATIAALFPGEALPKLHLILLGMGDDGHTASLFPHTRALDETDQWIVANQVPQQETWRMTMTYPLINAAEHIFFLVLGANKAERLHEVLHGELDAKRLPSQLICPTEGTLTWFVDKAAAASLPCV
jgi:6-phosphogluconolactonase